MSVLLEVNGLKKQFGTNGMFGRRSVVTALDDVSFSVSVGESLGIVGESGSGKTTLARCLLRLIIPESGTIKFEGTDIVSMSDTELRPLRMNMQMIFQDPYSSLNPRMTAGAIIEEPLIVHRIGTKTERAAKVSSLLNMVGLEPALKDRYPHEFSGGQRQRIGIARALALQPRLIVADEPVSALDVSIQAQIINLLKDLQEKLQFTFIFIAHDLSIVQHFCNRIAVMYMGRFVEIADSLELFRYPLHPYTRLLLDSIPAAGPAAKRLCGQSNPAQHTSANEASLGCNFHPRCAIAVDNCKQVQPQLRELRTNHWVACDVIKNDDCQVS
jgi:oligopeptide transport system ATP-binding protein